MTKNKRTQKSWLQRNWKYVVVMVPVIIAFIQFVAPEIVKNRDTPDVTESQQPTSITSAPTELVQVFGPRNGKLNHNAENDSIEIVWAKQNLLNFIVEAQFTNPYGASEHTWDYGFSFRQTTLDDAYRIYVTSDKRWELLLRQIVNGQKQTKLIADGTVENLNVASGQVNVLRLVVKDKTAEFFVNNSLVDIIPVGAKMESGDIGIGIGYLNDHEVDGKSTAFERFIISEFK